MADINSRISRDGTKFYTTVQSLIVMGGEYYASGSRRNWDDAFLLSRQENSHAQISTAQTRIVAYQTFMGQAVPGDSIFHCKPSKIEVAPDIPSAADVGEFSCVYLYFGDEAFVLNKGFKFFRLIAGAAGANAYTAAAAVAISTAQTLEPIISRMGLDDMSQGFSTWFNSFSKLLKKGSKEDE